MTEPTDPRDLARFAGVQWNAGDLGAMLRGVRGDRATAVQIMRLVGHFGRHPWSNYHSLDEAAAHAGITDGCTVETAISLRDRCIATVDARLQRVYRDFLAGNPPPVEFTHDERIAWLEATRSAAVGVVAAHDWDWLIRWLGLSQPGQRMDCLVRLSRFAFPCDRVNVRFTYHCNIECRHCYNQSGPKATRDRLSVESMVALVRAMPSAHLWRLNLTGGEPFLYFEDLLLVIATGRQVGLRQMSLYTNGFWATGTRTEAWLAQLSGAGFEPSRGDYLKVSTGAYHEEFLGVDRVVNLANAYARMFGAHLRVDVEAPAGVSVTPRDVVGRLSAAGLKAAVEVAVRPVAPLGRGGAVEVAALGPMEQPCGLIDQLVFDPDGTARPCCGYNADNLGIRIGSIGVDSVKDLLRRMQNDPVLQALSSRPLTELWSLRHSTQPEKGWASPCQLCQEAFGSLADKEPLQRQLFGRQSFYPFDFWTNL